MDIANLNQDTAITNISPLLKDGEYVVWKGKPKRISYILSCAQILPLAIIWFLFDASIIFGMFFVKNMSVDIAIILVIFFAIHMTPIWICMGQIVKSAKESKHIEYYITNLRIFKLTGEEYKTIKESISVDNLEGVQLKEGIYFKLFNTSNIFIKEKNQFDFSNIKVKNKTFDFSKIDKKIFVLYGIENGENVVSKITYIIANRDKAKFISKLKNTKVSCNYCTTLYNADLDSCPNCGATKSL